MPIENKDIFRAHRPRALVYIGGQVCAVEEYDITLNNKDEAGSCNIKIPLENIDASVFADPSVVKDLIEVQVFSGYVPDWDDDKATLERIKEAIKTHGSDDKNKFTKRFEGFVGQPEFEIGNVEMVHLMCLDWASFLHEYKFYENFEGSGCEVSNIVSKIKKDIVGLDIKITSYSGPVFMGDLDDINNHRIYHSSGKSYYEILKECAIRLGKKVIVEGKTITLAQYKENPVIWPLYYGPSDKQKDGHGNSYGQYFESAKIRYGQKGRVEKSNVVVVVSGINHTKKGKQKGILFTFPEDGSLNNITKRINLIEPGNSKKKELKILAEDAYRDQAKRLVTVTIELPFANNFMNVFDLIVFKPDESKKNLSFLQGVHFAINSISEHYSSNGYTQSIEADSDPYLVETVKAKIAPLPSKFIRPQQPGQTRLRK